MFQLSEDYEELEREVNSSNYIQVRIFQNRTSQIERLKHKIDDGLRRRDAGKKEDGNIAFKCNWNDKGYKGVCSDEVYEQNRKSLRSECARVKACSDMYLMWLLWECLKNISKDVNGRTVVLKGLTSCCNCLEHNGITWKIAHMPSAQFASAITFR